jgi:hypothetical protein
MLRSSVARLVALVCLSVMALTSVASAKVPRPLANLPIQTPDRKNIDLKRYHGKVLCLVLFLTECPECVGMVDFASKLQTDLGARGFQVIGVAVDDKAAYLVQPFVQRYRPSFPVGYLGKQDDIIKILDLAPGVRPVAPIIMFIDSTGFVRFQYSGKDTAFINDRRTLRTIAEGLINQKDGKEQPVRVTK